MFLLSKLLPLFVLPLGVTKILLSHNIITGKRSTSIAGLVILWIFSTPLTTQKLWQGLEYPFERKTFNNVFHSQLNDTPKAIVVLGSMRHPAPGSAQISEWGDADRFFGGLEVYSWLKNNHRRSRLIFSGGWRPKDSKIPLEGEVLRIQAIKMGVPPQDLSTTGSVENTAAEAKAISKIIPRNSKLVLVTSAFHMARASKLFEQEGFDITPFPVDFQAKGGWAGNPLKNPLNYFPSASALHESSRALKEYLGRTIYRAWN